MNHDACLPRFPATAHETNSRRDTNQAVYHNSMSGLSARLETAHWLFSRPIVLVISSLGSSKVNILDLINVFAPVATMANPAQLVRLGPAFGSSSTRTIIVVIIFHLIYHFDTSYCDVPNVLLVGGELLATMCSIL